MNYFALTFLALCNGIMFVCCYSLISQRDRALDALETYRAANFVADDHGDIVYWVRLSPQCACDDALDSGDMNAGRFMR